QSSLGHAVSGWPAICIWRLSQSVEAGLQRLAFLLRGQVVNLQSGYRPLVLARPHPPAAPGRLPIDFQQKAFCRFLSERIFRAQSRNGVHESDEGSATFEAIASR